MRHYLGTQSLTLMIGLVAAFVSGGQQIAYGQDGESMPTDAPAASLKLRIQSPPANRSDSLVNGTLIGAAVGFGAGFVTLAAFNAKATESGPIWSSENVGYYTGAGIIGAGVGALIGAITDASIRRNTRLPRGGRFIAVIPVYRRAAYGLRVTLLY